MLDFKPLELKDKDIISEYLEDYSFKTYEYTFLTLYLWRKMFSTKYSFIDNALIIRKSDSESRSCFMQPLGYTKDNLNDIVLKLMEYKKNNPAFLCLFANIEDKFLNELKDIFVDRITFRDDMDNNDYIYDTEQLINLSGKKFHGKKNHYNQFVNSYNYEVKDLSLSKVREDCIGFAREWFKEKNDNSPQLIYELDSIVDVLTNAESLEMLLGIAVYVDGKITGFTIGEKVPGKMGIVHFEKGNTQYNGIYAFINKAMAEKHFYDVPYINRQEDMGIPGLRKAKLAYNPIMYGVKYIVNVE